MPDETLEGQQPQALSAEDVAKIVNQAVTSHLSRALPKALETALGGVTKAFDEKLAGLSKAPEGGTGQAPDKQQSNPELTALQQKINELLAANKASEERALAVERKAREDAAFGELKAELGKHIKPEFADPIAKSLYFADKRVEFDESGKPLFRALVPQYAGGPLQETLLPMRDGIEAFAKSKEAEPYRPPPTPKTPNLPAQRFAQTGQASTIANSGKVPSVTEDPTWATRVTQELIAAGIPTGDLG